MDIPTIAIETVALLSPFLTEGGKELAKSATKDLWNFLKDKFKGKKEEQQLQEFEQNPTDAKRINRLEMALEIAMESDEVLKSELEKLIREATQEIKGNTISNNTKTVAGNNIQSKGDTHITIN